MLGFRRGDSRTHARVKISERLLSAKRHYSDYESRDADKTFSRERHINSRTFALFEKAQTQIQSGGSNRRMRTHGIPRREHYSFKCIKARTQNQYANTAIEGGMSGKHKGRICDTGKFYARNKKIRTHRHSGRCYDERGDDFGMCANFKTRGL